ncbi:MAG: zinc ribbon domain-containing protein [Anaerolineales bacterium]
MTQKELGYIELEWTCTHCGTINPGMVRVCTNCGAPITADDKFELPDQQQLITDKDKLEEAKKGPAIQCPYCNVLNPADAKLCIQCGGDIQAGLARQAGQVLGVYETASVPDKPCPFCNQPVRANAQRCPHCGGSLVEAAQSVATPARSKKTPLWLIAGGITLGVLCLASVIAFIVLNNRTSDVTATVSGLKWWRGIAIEELQPVQKNSWNEDVPSQAQDVVCHDEYKETSNNPAPNATEVCGTPYTIDVGSGAGKVVQDCEYQIYASYCDYTIMDWVVVNTVTAEGTNNNPDWPEINLQAGQREAVRRETYEVTFEADGESYAYIPANSAEFSQFNLTSEWLVSVNSFGDIKDVRSP